MPREVILRFFLIGAVLLAQQTALAHQYWHASSKVAAAEQSQPVKGDALCDLHDLLGTVLGAACGAGFEADFLALPQPGFKAAPVAAREAFLLTHHSRDPPPLS